jgi:tRNA(Ile)-lysidine synthase
MLAIDVAGLPRALCRMLARTAIQRVRDDHGITAPAFTEASNVEALLDALAARHGATQGGVMVQARGEVWHFCPEPPRRSG